LYSTSSNKYFTNPASSFYVEKPSFYFFHTVVLGTAPNAFPQAEPAHGLAKLECIQVMHQIYLWIDTFVWHQHSFL
jgi:hypothetical protein